MTMTMYLLFFLLSIVDGLAQASTIPCGYISCTPIYQYCDTVMKTCVSCELYCGVNVHYPDDTCKRCEDYRALQRSSTSPLPGFSIAPNATAKIASSTTGGDNSNLKTLLISSIPILIAILMAGICCIFAKRIKAYFKSFHKSTQQRASWVEVVKSVCCCMGENNGNDGAIELHGVVPTVIVEPTCETLLKNADADEMNDLRSLKNEQIPKDNADHKRPIRDSEPVSSGPYALSYIAQSTCETPAGVHGQRLTAT